MKSISMEVVDCRVCRASGKNAVRVRDSADIIQCPDCGLVYLRTRPTVEELEKQYQAYASTPGSHMALPTMIQQLKTSGLRRDEMMIEILTHTGPDRERFLDVGSGWGAFLLNAREHGFQVNGVEICLEMADFATKVLGIYTHAKQLEFCDFASGSVQVVSMIHSLEHLPDTASALQYVHRILQPGGYFCGIVPNFDSWASNKHKERWIWLDPVVHYVHWTPETLKKSFFAMGFNLLKMYTTTGDYNRSMLPIGAELAKLEKEGKGEEIRFFAQKI